MTDQQQALADLLETFVPAGTIAGGIAYARIGWQDEGELRTAIAAAQEFAATAALAVSIMERVARARLADAGVSEDDEQAPGLWPAALRYVPDHELQAAADAVTPGDVTAELPAAELMSVTAERLKRFRSTDY
jgi:hypothetical protein